MNMTDENPMQVYWTYLQRVPPDESLRGYQYLPTLYQDIFTWMVVFSLGYIALPHVLKYVWPTWYDSLDKRKKREMPSYVICLFHHLRVVPIAYYHFYEDITFNEFQLKDVRYAKKGLALVAFTLAYFGADTLFYAIPDALHGKYEYIIHHVLTIYLVMSSLYGPGELCRIIPHLYMCETSNILFNFAWLLRLTGYRDSQLVAGIEMSFAAAFFLTRVINLPINSYFVLKYPNIVGLGLARHVLLPLSILQFFWFYKVVKGIFSRLKERSKLPKKTQ